MTDSKFTAAKTNGVGPGAHWVLEKIYIFQRITIKEMYGSGGTNLTIAIAYRLVVMQEKWHFMDLKYTPC